MATRKGATKTVDGKRLRWNGTKWVQIKAQGNVTPTSSSTRASRSKNSTNTPTSDSTRTNRGGSSVTTNTRRTAKPTTPTRALPPGNKGGGLAIRNNNKRTSSSTTSSATPSSKPSLRSRAYVNLRRAGINPDKVTSAITKGATVRRLGGASAAAALTAHGLAATPGPTGRRVRATLDKQDKDRNSVMDMASAKGRRILEVLGLVDRKTTSKSKVTPKTVQKTSDKTPSTHKGPVIKSSTEPGSKTPPASSKTKTPPTKTPPAAKVQDRGKRDYGSSEKNLAAWAKKNKDMINKSGTKAQKAILAKALKPKNKTNNLSIRSQAQKSYNRGSA